MTATNVRHGGTSQLDIPVSEQQNRTPVRIPIRTKITIPYLFLAIFLAIGVAVLVTRIVFDTVEERFNNQLIEAGKISSEWMVREEDRLLETLRLLSRTESIPAAIKTNDSEALRNRSFGIVVNNGEDFVQFTNAEGELILAMRHRTGGSLEAYDFAQGGSQYSDWANVQHVLNGESDQYGDKYVGVGSTETGRLFYVVGPIFDDDGSLAGTIIVGKFVDRLIADLQQETRIQVSLYDFEGELLASTFSEGQSISPELAASTIEFKDSQSARRELSEVRDVVISNIEYEEILGAWEGREGLDLGVIGSALSRTYLVRSSNVTRLQIFLLVVCAVLLVILVGLYISRLITRPLQGLVSAASQVAQGDLNVQLDIHSNDEIEILNQSFNQMVLSLQSAQDDLLTAYDGALDGWAKALELRDQITEGHTRRVVQMTLEIAREFGFSDEELVHVRRGALLHDIGKMGIPDSILQKAGKLSDEEWVIMRKHPVYSYDLIKGIEFLLPALDIPLYHHEKWNGKGYPRGLKGEEIPLAARIFAIVDVWDAITSDRPYRKAWSREQALDYIQARKGIDFDPEVVAVFLSLKLDKSTG